MRGVAAWIAFLGLSYVVVALVLIDAVPMLARLPGDPASPGLPWSLTARELLVGAGALAALALATAIQLWRMVPSGRMLGVVFLLSVAMWAGFQAWSTGDAMSWAFSGLNVWFGTFLLRQDAARACAA